MDQIIASKNSKNIWLIAILIVIIGVLLGGGIYFSQKISLQDNQATDLQNKVATLEQDKKTLQGETATLQSQLDKNPQSQNLNYTNDQYGFSLNFPASWDGYKIKQREINWGMPAGTSTSFDFGFDAQDSIFNISVLTLSQWSQIQAQEGPKPTFLGSNSSYVFVYDLSQYAANDAMSARRNEVASVVATFKLK